jgi:uncharacterized RDD family membrane protein YckC
MSAGGFLQRTLAFPLDLALVGAVWLLGALWLVIVYAATADNPAQLVALALLAGAALGLGLVLNAAYFVGFVGGCGQTPGQMVFGVRVICGDGGRVGYARALLRWIGYGLVFATLGLGWLMALLDRQRRGLHDWIAGTRVVRSEGGSAPLPNLPPSGDGAGGAGARTAVSFVSRGRAE